MDEDSTPVSSSNDDGGTGDDFDISAEDHSQNTSTTAADSLDDTEKKGDDNQPSNSDDKSGDDESKGKSDESNKTPSFDKDLDQWAEDRGYGALETDKERRMAQDARNQQRDYSRRSEAQKTASKLAEVVANTTGEADKDDDPLVQRLNSLETTLMSERESRKVGDYFAVQAEGKTPVTEAEAQAMASLLEQTAKTDGKAGVDFLVKNLDRWRGLASRDVQASSNDSDTKAQEAADKARQEERERIAKQQQANGPSRSAKVIAPAKETDEVAKIWADDSI